MPVILRLVEERKEGKDKQSCTDEFRDEAFRVGEVADLTVDDGAIQSSYPGKEWTEHAREWCQNIQRLQES